MRGVAKDKINQPDENWTACSVCFVQKSKRVKAVCVINGLSACEDHVELVSQPTFNIIALGTRRAV
jgi:hypothetical protein